MVLYYPDTNNKQLVSLIPQKCKDDTRCTAYDYNKLEPGLPSGCSRNNRRTCLRSCSKEGFKAVSILIANVSCEIWLPAIITTTYKGIRRKLKNVLAILTTYMEDQALKRYTTRLQQSKRKKNLPPKSSAFHNCSC